MYNSMYNNFFPYQGMRGVNSTNLLRGSGLLKGISKINWGNMLTNTQKTLNVINQAIPVYYQVKPIYNNAKTMFRVFGALKTDNNQPKTTQKINNQKKNTSSNKPIFFVD